MDDEEINLVRPKQWSNTGRRCNECGNTTWECVCISDNLSEE